VCRELDPLIRALEEDRRALHARYMHRLIAIADRMSDTKPHADAVTPSRHGLAARRETPATITAETRSLEALDVSNERFPVKSRES
jgi:hypothetical protein